MNKFSDVRKNTVNFVKKNRVAISATTIIACTAVGTVLQWKAINRQLAEDLKNPDLR